MLIMKQMTRTLAIAAAALFAGCYSIDIASTSSLKDSAISPESEKTLEHVVVSNYGWYLFNCIPLVCGNASLNASFPWKFFSNQVTADILHDRMMMHAAAANAHVKDLVFLRDEKVIFDLPGTDFPIPIPYVLCYREIQFSGVLTQIKDETPSNEDKQRKTIDEMNQLLNKLNPEK